LATSKNYRDFVEETLKKMGDITIRPMMGEYLLYYKGTLFGGIYDNRVLIKKCNGNKKYNMEEGIPYKGAKTMYKVDIDNTNLLEEIIIITSKEFEKNKNN